MRRAVATLASFALAGLAAGSAASAAESGTTPATRVTVFGDSAAAAMAYDPAAKRILGRGIDLRLEVAACRRLALQSCPYDGVRPPNVVDRATTLGRELGPVVIVIVGYNDFEEAYAENIEEALGAFRKAGVERVLWATLRAGRPSWARMNADIAQAAKKHPEMTVLDWDGQSRAHPAWLQPDGIHLTPEGARGMARMVNATLVQLGVAPGPFASTPVRRLSIAVRTLPQGRVGRPYASRIRALGGDSPYRWKRTNGALPPGVRLTPAGRLVGTPRHAGRFRFVLRVADHAGAVRTRSFVLAIVG